jgi:hypothetical protein
MHCETGEILRGDDLRAAVERDEPVMPVTKGFAEWVETLSDEQRRKVARTLANIRRCQPHLSLTKAQNLARRTTVLTVVKS